MKNSLTLFIYYIHYFRKGLNIYFLCDMVTFHNAVMFQVWACWIYMQLVSCKWVLFIKVGYCLMVIFWRFFYQWIINSAIVIT